MLSIDSPILSAGDLKKFLSFNNHVIHCVTKMVTAYIFFLFSLNSWPKGVNILQVVTNGKVMVSEKIVIQ